MENSEFRKPSSDFGGRKYRKRSPSSSSSHGSPRSPASSRKNQAKIAHDKQSKDDGRDYASGRGGESHKHSSSRNRDRHADDYDRGYSSRDVRGTRHQDYPNDEDKYRWEKSDANEHRKRYDDRDRHGREPEKHYDAKKSFSSKDQNFDSKKPKVSGWEPWDNVGSGTNGTSEKASVTVSDMDAAKVAAIKAAEQVNKNLVGTGFMSADQKKKLLWGNKRSTTTEEPAHRWNSAIFGDRERQEKFNKLMGVKGEPKVDQKLDDQNAEKQREKLQMELEKQYTAGLRRKDGRTVGLGL